MSNFLTELVRGQSLWDEAYNENIAALNKDLQTGNDVKRLSNNKSNTIDVSTLTKASVPDIRIKGRSLSNLIGKYGDPYTANYTALKQIGCNMVTDATKMDDAYMEVTVTKQGLGKIATDGLTNINDKIIYGKFYIAAYEVESKYADIASIVISPAVTKVSDVVDVPGNKDVKLVYTVAEARDHATMLITLDNTGLANDIKVKIRNIRIYEITSDEVAELVYKNYVVSDVYPFVNSYACIVGPTIESYEDIFSESGIIQGFSDGNGFLWESNGSKYVISRKTFRLSKDTFYTLSHNAPQGITIRIKNEVNNVSKYFEGTFNTGNTEVFFLEATADGTVEGATELMEKIKGGEIRLSLVKGKVAKDSAQCINTKVTFNTSLHNGEMIENDGVRYFKHNNMNEVDLSSDDVVIEGIHWVDNGYKDIKLTLPHKFDSDSENNVLVMWDGSIAYNQKLGKSIYGSAINSYSLSNKTIILRLLNKNTGWGNNYLPTIDEIKAHLLGWIMTDDESDKIYERTDGLHKKWYRLWSGMGNKSHISDTIADIVTDVTSNRVPMAMNPIGFRPYKLYIKREKELTETVDIVGSLMISPLSNIRISAGYIYNEAYRILLYNKDTTIINGVHRSDGGSVLKHKISDILELTTMTGTTDYQVNENSGNLDAVNYQGYKNISLSANNLFENIFISYKTTSDCVLNNFDVSFVTADSTVSSLKDILIELANTKFKLSNALNKINATGNYIGYTNPNLLVNGDFKIWQRGTSMTNLINKYCADRWNAFHVNKTSKTSTGILFSGKDLKYARMRQAVEIDKSYINKKMTATIKYKNLSENTDIALIILQADMMNYGTGYNVVSSTSNTSSGTLSVTFSLPDSSRHIIFDISINDTTLTANREYSVEIEYAKLEIGEVPTPFVLKSYQEELNDCKRYYQRIRPCVFDGKIDNIHYLHDYGTDKDNTFKIGNGIRNIIKHERMRVDNPNINIGFIRKGRDFDISVSNEIVSAAVYGMSIKHIGIMDNENFDIVFINDNISITEATRTFYTNGSGLESITNGIEYIELDAEIY